MEVSSTIISGLKRLTHKTAYRRLSCRCTAGENTPRDIKQQLATMRVMLIICTVLVYIHVVQVFEIYKWLY